MANKAYLEITNVCNLRCGFCHGTKRAPAFITEAQFAVAAKKLRPFCDYLYFHLMGEPLLHPLLPLFFDIAADLGFKVIITTNGTLLKEKAEVLLNAKSLHKVSVSLHAYESNVLPYPLEVYLENCFEFCDKAAKQGIIAVMRLWNIGGKEVLNDRIVGEIHRFFDGENPAAWEKRFSGQRIRERLYLEWGELFEWPDLSLPVVGNRHGCYGLRDQLGVLCDGTVVPCCLDAEGAAALGNIFNEKLEDILSSPKAMAVKEGFKTRKITEPLCMRCGFAYGRFGEGNNR